MYRNWAETKQCVFVRMLEFKGIKAELDHMFLYRNLEHWFWSYDDRGRLMREDILEPDASAAEIVKLAPADVLTAAAASKLRAPSINPLPDFDEYVLGKQGN